MQIFKMKGNIEFLKKQQNLFKPFWFIKFWINLVTKDVCHIVSSHYKIG